jgi:perosamine synthetase
MVERLAIHGGKPVRSTMLPYGRQHIDDADIAAVVDVLKSDWLTTGPKVAEFERAFAEFVGAEHAVAVSNGTAALHAAMFALGIGPGDEVIVPPMTFAASANCVVYQGGIPVFADVEPDTLLLDPAQVKAKITPRTRAIISVDYAGQPCDYDALRAIAERHGLALLADACHSLGGTYNGRRVGTLADLSAFSFHPVKHITTGEGGMITTHSASLAPRLRRFRTHGINSDSHIREQQGSWFYEMVELGYNYRMTDIQSALGRSQLKKLPHFLGHRRMLARLYYEKLSDIEWLQLPQPGDSSAWHLYVVRLKEGQLRANRAEVYAALRAENVGVNVHYIPVHLHPYYQQRFGYKPGDFPVAETAYAQAITLPLHHMMSGDDVDSVVKALWKIGDYYGAG